MSDTQHTPEPWKIGDFQKPFYAWAGQILGTHQEDGREFVLASMNQNFEALALANARRIVACVNACRGFPTDGLESDRPLKETFEAALQVMGEANTRTDGLLQTALRERDEARAMVAELADKVQWLIEAIEMEGLGGLEEDRAVLNKARAYLAALS